MELMDYSQAKPRLSGAKTACAPWLTSLLSDQGINWHGIRSQEYLKREVPALPAHCRPEIERELASMAQDTRPIGSDPMLQNQLTALLAYFSATLVEKSGIGPAEIKMREAMFQTTLADLPLYAIQEAALAHLKTEKFFPQPADIYVAAKGIVRRHTLRERQLAALLERVGED